MSRTKWTAIWTFHQKCHGELECDIIMLQNYMLYDFVITVGHDWCQTLYSFNVFYESLWEKYWEILDYKTPRSDAKQHSTFLSCHAFQRLPQVPMPEPFPCPECPFLFYDGWVPLRPVSNMPSSCPCMAWGPPSPPTPKALTFWTFWLPCRCSSLTRAGTSIDLYT